MPDRPTEPSYVFFAGPKAKAMKEALIEIYTDRYVLYELEQHADYTDNDDLKEFLGYLHALMDAYEGTGFYVGGEYSD